MVYQNPVAIEIKNPQHIMLRAFKIIESNFYLPSSCCIEEDILFTPKLHRKSENSVT